VGSFVFMICWYMKPEYVDLVLPDNTGRQQHVLWEPGPAQLTATGEARRGW
jgi:hypothetical protein